MKKRPALPGWPARSDHARALLLLAALTGAAAAQEQEQTVPCPVAELETRIVTRLPQPWRDTPARGALQSLQVRDDEDGQRLLCVYGEGATRIAVSRSAPDGSGRCRADPDAGGFRCAPTGSASLDRCAAAVQNRIAWDYHGHKIWQPANLRLLCGSAGDSEQPARCFRKVMHGGIDHGNGTRWDWRNAVNLCASTRNARLTIGCFVAAIRVGTPWRNAIRDCTGG